MSDLHVRRAGEGMPLVCLHAFPCDSRLYTAQLDAPPDGFEVVCPDLPGFGRSPASGIERMRDYADAVLGVLPARPFVVAGTSMGGYVAFALWRRVPQLIRGFVLADTRAGTDTPEAKRGREESAQRVEREGVAGLVEDLLPRLVGPRTIAERPEVAERIREMGLDADPAGVAAALRAMGGRPDSTDLVAGITVPTLVLVGSDDGLTGPDVARDMADRLPHASCEVIDGAGHLTPIEAPDAFTGVLTRFAATIDRG